MGTTHLHCCDLSNNKFLWMNKDEGFMFEKYIVKHAT